MEKKSKSGLMADLSDSKRKGGLTNSQIETLIESLWRDELVLYREKYNHTPAKDEEGNPIDPLLRSRIAATVLNGLFLGQANLIEGNRSAAIGQGLNTKSFMELLIGAYATIATGQNPAAWVATDRLMALGNGPDANNRSLAFEVFKSGLLKLFNALVIGDFAHGESPGIPGAIRFHESTFQGFIADWITFLTDAPSDTKTYGRKDGAWIEIIAGADGREIEISTSGGHIVWRYVGDIAWTNLVALSTIEGDAGAPGNDGREIEISTSGGYIVWRYVGDIAWTNLVALSTLEGDAGAPGDDGREIEISTSGGYIVWRYVGDLSWTNLVALSTLEGDAGAPGDDGREVEISTSGGYIVWRYVGDVSWTNLVDLSTLKGDTGPAGAPIQVGSLTLTAASWSLVSGTYEYNLANANILATSIVDVIPDNADVATVKTAEIYPRTESSAGSVKLYSKNLPGANIGVTINIF